MKNQRVQFEAVDGSSLRISLSKNRKGEFKTTVRHRDAQEGRVRIGCKNYFEVQQEGEAQTSFDQLVKDAISNGWTRQANERKRKAAFTEVPQAPSLLPEPEPEIRTAESGPTKRRK